MAGGGRVAPAGACGSRPAAADDEGDHHDGRRGQAAVDDPSRHEGEHARPGRRSPRTRAGQRSRDGRHSFGRAAAWARSDAERPLLLAAGRAGGDVQLHLVELGRRRAPRPRSRRAVPGASAQVIVAVPPAGAPGRGGAAPSRCPPRCPSSPRSPRACSPSTSWSTNTARAPGGSSPCAASRSKPASGPARFSSGAFSKGVRSSVAKTRDGPPVRATGAPRGRCSPRWGRATTRTRCRPRKESSFRQARTNTSWVSSSAREASATCEGTGQTRGARSPDRAARRQRRPPPGPGGPGPSPAARLAQSVVVSMTPPRGRAASTSATASTQTLRCRPGGRFEGSRRPRRPPRHIDSRTSQIREHTPRVCALRGTGWARFDPQADHGQQLS